MEVLKHFREWLFNGYDTRTTIGEFFYDDTMVDEFIREQSDNLCSVEINGNTHIIDKDVLNLIRCISIERDDYKEKRTQIVKVGFNLKNKEILQKLESNEVSEQIEYYFYCPKCGKKNKGKKGNRCLYCEKWH